MRLSGYVVGMDATMARAEMWLGWAPRTGHQGDSSKRPRLFERCGESERHVAALRTDLDECTSVARQNDSA